MPTLSTSSTSLKLSVPAPSKNAKGGFQFMAYFKVRAAPGHSCSRPILCGSGCAHTLWSWRRVTTMSSPSSSSSMAARRRARQQRQQAGVSNGDQAWGGHTMVG